MDNIELLEEEYNNYLRLSKEKNILESSLKQLSGHNDEESIRKMNEIAKRLGQINNELSLYDKNILANVQSYFILRNRFNQLSKDIKAIEELSKEGKRPNKEAQFLTLSSPEGRNKQIDRELASDYISLAEEKNKLKKDLNNYYESIKNKESIKNSIVKEEIEDNKKIDYVLPEIRGYDQLSIEDKIKETKNRLERIFESSKLPNMGKKVLVNYNDKKYEIPEKYKGIFNSTYLELKKLEGKNNNIVKDSFSVTLNNNESSTENLIVDAKVFNPSIKHDEEMYKKMGVPFDFERQKRINDLVTKIFDSRGEEVEKIRFREGVKQKINTARGYVGSTSKKVTSYLKDSVKRVVIESNKLKEKVGKKKNDVSYQIVNRTTKFKDNTCQKINESKGRIIDIKKDALEIIRKPFNILREKKNNYVTKKELMEMVSLLKEQNNLLINQNKALTRKLVNNSGFISTIFFIIATSVLITILIFLVVGFIVFG